MTKIEELEADYLAAASSGDADDADASWDAYVAELNKQENTND